MENLRFEDINLSKEMQKGIEDIGFEEMSPIQSQAIPLLLEGRDIIGQAQTGTGKTAAFGIPLLEKCDPRENYVQALVLCPTRELSIQVAEEIARLGKHKKGISVVPIYGGQPIDRQIKALKKGVTIVIGTPGRVLDHIRRKTLKIENVTMMVLDEADEMFDMGFREDIALVMDKLSEERQTIFFSATMPNEIMKFAKTYQNNPEIVKVVHKELTVPKVDQAYFELKENMKTEILSRLVDIYDPKLTVVFCNTKKRVDDLTEELQGRGYSVDGLHGDLKQTQRDGVMGKFRKGIIDILVATDVAARGIDVDDVDMVINYDMPQDEEYYVHRIGRTARAGREGMAFSFVAGKDIHKLKNVQRYIKTKIPMKKLPTLKDIEANYTTSMLDKIKREVDEENLEKYEKILELIIQEDYTSFEIAAALLKFYMVDNKFEGHQELDMVDYHSKKIASPQERVPMRSGPMVRLHINIGKRKGVSPRHILSAMLESTGMSKNYIGNIDLYDKFTFVEVPKDVAEEIIEKVDGTKIRGIKVKVEVANPKRKQKTV